MSNRLDFEIEFKSDFHIGAGHGLGQQVDSALLRDPDGVPVLRGTVLEGLLRDSLANLLAADLLKDWRRCTASGAQIPNKAFCGQWTVNEPDCPICAIFGSPCHPKRWDFSSARPVGLTAPQNPRQAWRAGETAAQTTTRVRVNPRTRRAEENKLFTREEGDGSLRFRFTVETVTDAAAADEEAAWLVAAARSLRNLGASKYRGRGECEIHLVDRQQEKTLLDRFNAVLSKTASQPAPQVASTITVTVARLAPPPQVEDHAYRLRVLLRADEPLLIARRAEAGNQFETLEGIPGGVLRGALAWRMAQRAGAEMAQHTSDTYRNFVDLFFRDGVRFSTLLPMQLDKEHPQGYPTLPAPRDLLTCELHPGYPTDDGHGVYSLAWDEAPPEECPQCQKLKTKLESVGGFLPLRSVRPTTKFQLQRTTEMHIRLQPETRRVQTGDLFGYVLLEPGQYFVGEITCANETTWEALRQMAGLEPVGKVNVLRLGKANRRGYGKVSLVCATLSKSPWRGPAIADRVTDPDKVILTLLSDALVTDPWGRFARGFEADWLRRELGLPQGVTVEIAAEDQHQRRFSAVRTVDAFNAKLGLPRTRDVALVAGSSVRLVFKGIALSELQTLLDTVEQRGIGLRRDEGFGRVAFNHPIHQQCASWSDGALMLGALALGGALQDHDQVRIARFEQDWREKLDASFTARSIKDFEDGRFEAVARLEHVSGATSQGAAAAALAGLGKQEQLLLHPLAGRDKKNFYETDGRPGIDKVLELLTDLGTLIAEQKVEASVESRLWRIGLQMLADRIAEPARRKAQGGR